MSDGFTCRWTGTTTPRAIVSAHLDDCPGDCKGCLPCAETHCMICAKEHTDTVCPRCVGATRADLADIVTLVTQLPDQAANGGGDGKLIAAAPIPGGDATVMLGPGSLGESQQLAESRGEDASHRLSESGTDPNPPLLVLATWEDAWRSILGDGLGPRATVERCVGYLSRKLGEAAATGDPFPEMADDLRKLRVRLENVLDAGVRDLEGVRCLDPYCGALLRQAYADPRPCTHITPARAQFAAWLTYDVPVSSQQLRDARTPCGRTSCDQGGRRDTWFCPACKREYTDVEYRRAVAQDHAEASPLRTGAEITRVLGVPSSRLQVWATRNRIARHGKDARGRTLYDLQEVRRHVMGSGAVA